MAVYSNGDLDSMNIRGILNTFETPLRSVEDASTKLGADYEGRMYRELGKDKLKIYHYRLIGSELYGKLKLLHLVYRHKDDKEHKQIIYLGHGCYLQDTKSKFMSAKD